LLAFLQLLQPAEENLLYTKRKLGSIYANYAFDKLNDKNLVPIMRKNIAHLHKYEVILIKELLP
jgi:hypothetical protein